MSTTESTIDQLLDTAVNALGGSPRDGQRDMSHSVANALHEGEHLLVQAGTGTGKSLGYLVPAVHHAVTTNQRVIVSTATLALQRQIMTRDLPLVADALATSLPRRPEIAVLKGWSNYACLHKVHGGYPTEEQLTLFDTGPSQTANDPTGTKISAPEYEGIAAQVKRATEWVNSTDTGDRDDLVPGVSDRVWRQISIDKLECMGSKCPFIDECFPEFARQSAHEADVLVTNHTMVGIAATGSPHLFPEFDALIVDEAHELVDRVTSSATVELSIGSLEHTARLARRHGGVATGTLDFAIENLALVLEDHPEQTFAQGLPEDIQTSVEAIRDASRTLVSQLAPKKDNAGDGSDPGLKMAQAAMVVLFEIAERMAADSQGGDVLWCSRSRSAHQESPARLHAAPLGVANLLATNLWASHTGVITSATLSLGKSFDPVARGLGVDVSHDPETGLKRSWNAQDVGSPFDYAKQGILYIARDLPTPGMSPTTESQLDTIAELIEAAGGRALGLFSSRRAAQHAAEALRERLDYPILCQGDDQLPTLVQEFSEDTETCLFGTLSLWQGVDVPGDSCQLVIMDRIPFPRPDDPVKSARARAIAQSGGNGFMQISASHAALLLAQGAGRLIRSIHDKGVVAVLDPRLETARYGSFLTGSMPDFWRTTRKDVAVSALRRLRGET
ncbi:ATP-dependent DNA helicase [Timonella sp. A28]|uniref:ATP-dependent DNA helicase n=1 Tax=Timonella sp. A28 TaxID=3442640 RepID=UPI003EB844D9